MRPFQLAFGKLFRKTLQKGPDFLSAVGRPWLKIRQRGIQTFQGSCICDHKIIETIIF